MKRRGSNACGEDEGRGRRYGQETVGHMVKEHDLRRTVRLLASLHVLALHERDSMLVIVRTQGR